MDFFIKPTAGFISPDFVSVHGALYKNDCVEVLKTLPNNSIDLIVSDVPYHIVIGSRCSNRQGYPAKKQGKLFEHDNIEFSDYLPLLYDKLKDNSHCYLMINEKNLAKLQTEAEKLGFKFQQLIIWNKGNALPNHYYMRCYECILMLRKGNAKDINDMTSRNILDIPNIKTGTKVHPTEKPVDLMKILIENSSKPNDIVLDPFMGSGSTGVAALGTDRRFVRNRN